MAYRRFEDALPNVHLLVTSVRDWIPLRRQTIRTLRNIATDLNNIKENVNITKASGTLMSAAGTVVAVGALFVAAPPLDAALGLFGTITSLFGGVTAQAGDTIGTLISDKRKKEAQIAMDNEKEAHKEIEQISKELVKIADEISKVTGVSREQVLSLLLIAQQRGCDLGYNSIFKPMTSIIHLGRVFMFMESSSRRLSRLISKIMVLNSVKGAANVAKNIGLRGLSITGTGALILWDITELVRTVMDMNEGSTCSTACFLFKLANEYEVETNEWLGFLSELELSRESLQRGHGTKKNAKTKGESNKKQATATNASWQESKKGAGAAGKESKKSASTAGQGSDPPGGDGSGRGEDDKPNRVDLNAQKDMEEKLKRESPCIP